MTDFNKSPPCVICGSHPLPHPDEPHLIGCGAGVRACKLTENPTNFPKFTKQQWDTVMRTGVHQKNEHPLQKLADNIVDNDPEFQKAIEENFEDLI